MKIVLKIALSVMVFFFISSIFMGGISCGVDANGSTASIEIKTIETALKMHKLTFGHYPNTKDGLSSLVEAKTFPDGLIEQFLPELPMDPWNNAYIYRYPAQQSKTLPWDLYSMGPNGIDDHQSNDDIHSNPTDI
ncbi:MAG: type II secretion system protein GspG [Psychrosphaera sp.]|nr:type II secretion system protein GspG [Psychrosphaera sp.]